MERVHIRQNQIIPAILLVMFLVMFLAVPALAGIVIPDNVSNANSDFIPGANDAGAGIGLYGNETSGCDSAGTPDAGIIVIDSESDDAGIGESGKPGSETLAANFSADVTGGEAPLVVAFTEASTGDPTAWAWDFENDGVVDSTEQSPTHTYTTAGTYTVNLTVTNDAGSDTVIDYITVTSSSTTIELPQQNGLNLTVVDKQRPSRYDSVHPGTYFFNIGNNMYNGGQNAIHISDSYLTPYGTITVSDSPTGTFYITDTGGKGYEDEAILLIAVQESEFSEDFSIDLAVEGYRFLDHAADGMPTVDEVGTFNSEAYVATLNASDFLIYDGALVSQTWKPSTGSDGDVNKKFFDGQDLGGPKYNLILVDLNTSIVGRNAAYQKNLTNYGNPKVTYTIHGYSGGNVSFAPYAWVSYQTGGGSYFDRTIGWTSRSSTNSWLVTLEEVGTAPVADFSADVTSGEAPLSVQFTDLSTGSPTAWAWDFENDGVVDSTEQNPAYTYATEGTYTVNLTVTNAAGSGFEVKTDYITVSDGSGGETPATIGLADTPWPKFNYDLNNTGQSPYIGPQTNTIKWTFPLGSTATIQAGTAIGPDGTLYIGSGDGTFYALNPDGTKKWSYASGAPITSTPAIGSDGTIYFTHRQSSSKYIFALNPDGTLKWKFQTIGFISASPTIGSDGTIYIGSYGSSSSGRFYAINPDGTEKWSYQTGAIYSSSAAIGPEGTIYVGGDNRNLYAFKPDGTLKWTYYTGNNIHTSPAIGPDGTIYVANYNTKKINAINPDGTLKWAYTTGGALLKDYGSMGIGADGTIYVGNYGDKKLYAVNPDGTLKWTYTLDARIYGSSPVIGADGTIYFGSDDMNVYALNPDGSIKWTYATGGKVEGTPTIGSDGTLYIVSQDGNYYAFAGVVDCAADTTSGTAPLSVQFTGTSTLSPTSWLWDFGDGANATEQNPSHMYTSAGNYTVNLTVTSEAGSNSIVKTNYIKVTGSSSTTAPVANFTATPTSGTAPLAVQFTDLSTGSPTAWAWDFENDGTIDSTEQSPTHIYETAGTYTVNLTVTNAAGSGFEVKADLITVSGGSGGETPAAAGLADSAWPKFGGPDLNNTGRSPFVGAQTNATKWIYATGGQFRSAVPVIGSDGTVYIGNYDKNVYAFNPDGTLKWTYTTGGYLSGPPAMGADGTIYIGNYDDNTVYALNPDGTLKWTYTTTGVFFGGPTIGPDGTIYIGNTGSDRSLYALNPDGTKKWSYSCGGNTYSIPAIGSDGTIYFVATRSLFAVNPDGTLKWSYATGGSISSAPSIGPDGSIYVGSGDNKFYALNPDGTLNWTYTSGGRIYSSPAIGTDGTIYFGDYGDNKIYALNPDGTVKWTYLTGGAIRYSSPAIGADGTIYIGNYGDYKVYALNPDGTLKWFYETGNQILTSPAVAPDGTVYIGSTDGNLYAFAGVVTATADTPVGQAPLTVNFQGTSPLTVTAWHWDFGDGTTSTEQNPSHTYASAGSYTVNLTVTHSDGTNYHRQTEYIKAYDPPVAGFAADITEGPYPLAVQFTDASTGSPTSWAWDFGDGSTSDEQNPVHAYTSAGTYTVTLTAANPAGSNTTTRTGYITVSTPVIPQASFTASQTAGAAPLTVRFNDTSLYQPTSWLWDFGDGNTSTEQNPSHTYSYAGTFTVSLNATNSGGSDTVTRTEYISVSDPAAPTASFAASGRVGIAPLTIRFTDTSKDYPTSWLWDFGDGTTSTEQNPAHTYTATGKYTVNLTATNADGSSSITQADYIVVIGTGPVPLPAGQSLNLYVANDEGVKYNVENGVTDSQKGYMPYVFIDNTYHFLYNGQGGGTNALHVSNDPSDVWGQVTTTTNQSGEFWLTHTGGQPNLHDAVLLLAVNGTIPDDFSVRIRSSGYDFEPPIPGVGNNNTIGDPVYVDGAINQTFTREDFIYGPQIWRPHRVSDYPIFVGQDMSDTANTFELMFIDLRLGCTQTKSDGYVRVEYELNNLTSFAVFNAYGWYSASNHGTGLIMTSSGSEYQVVGASGAPGPEVPAANFSANVTSGDAPLAVQFTDLSTGDPTAWAWDFENDGVIDSTEQSPAYTYATAGTYTVNLTVTNAAGSDTVTKADYITVSSPYPRPLPAYRNINIYVANDEGVKYDEPNGITRYGDIGIPYNYVNNTYFVMFGTAGGGTNPMDISNDPAGQKGVDGQITRSANQSGKFWVTFNGGQSYMHEGILMLAVNGTIPDDFSVRIRSSGYDFVAPIPGVGNNDTISEPVYVEGAVDQTFTKEDFIYGPQIWRPFGTPDLPIYCGQDMTDTENTFQLMFIDLNLGAMKTGTDQGSIKVEYQFNNLTSFAVFNSYGWYRASNHGTGIIMANYGSDYAVIGDGTYALELPVANFSATPTAGEAPLAVQFTDLSTNSPTAWAWDFENDGVVDSTEQSPSFTYATAGTYTVNLTVTNAAGSDAEVKTDYITVSEIPVANFTATPTAGDAPLAVQFTDLSTGTPTSWHWDFGDGTTATEQNPSHAYTGIGRFNVSLTAGNAFGTDTLTRVHYITVRDVPPGQPEREENFTFRDTGTSVTDVGGRQQVSFNTTTGNGTTSETDIVLKKGNMNVTIRTDGLTTTGDVSTGNVTGVQLESSPIRADLGGDIGNVSVGFNASMNSYNPDLGITTAIYDQPGGDAARSFTLSAAKDGLAITSTAYAVYFTKTNPTENISNAVLQMTVSPAWVNANGGRDAIRVFRQDDDGNAEVLQTTYLGLDADDMMVFEAISPGGFSAFAVVATQTVAAPTSVPGTSSSLGGGGRSAIGVGAAEKINAGETATLTFGEAPVTEIEVHAQKNIPHILITTKAGEMPEDADAPDGDVYKYVSVRSYRAPEDSLQWATIRFTVPTNWVNERLSSPDLLSLYYYDEEAGEWNPLSTVLAGEENGGYAYYADSVSFGYFAIVVKPDVKEVAASPVTTADSGQDSPETEPTVTGTDPATTARATPLFGGGMIVCVAVALFCVLALLNRKLR